MFPTLPFFGLQIPTYGLLILLGIALALLYASLRHQALASAAPESLSITGEDLLFSASFALIAGFLGAKILFLFTLTGAEYSVLWQHFDWQTAALLLREGFVLYGGILGGILGIALYARIFHLPVFELLAAFVPAVLLAQATGRLGCYLNGCCYGLAADPPLGVHFVSHVHTDATYLPLQLIEAAAVLVLAAALHLYTNRPRSPRRVVAFYLLGYPSLRFFLEFWRGDEERGLMGPLSLSQWFSLALFVAGLLLQAKTRPRLTYSSGTL